MTIRPKIRVRTDLFLYMYTTIRQKYMVLFHSFFCARPFDPKLGSTLIYFSYLHMTIRQKYMVLFHLFLLLCTTIRQKYMIFFLSFILSLCTTIRPKNRVLINLLFLFVHDHSTKSDVTLTVLFILFLDVPIFRSLYSWQILPLYFHRSASGSTALIFCLLYS